MAEETENVGGIEVVIGASDAKLEAVIERADAKLSSLYEKWNGKAIHLTGSASVANTPQTAARAVQPPPVSFGPGVQTRVQGQQAQTALQRAINAELSKTGEIFNAQTGDIESATKAYQAQRQAVAGVRSEAANLPPVSLQIDRTSLSAELNSVLEELRAFKGQADELLNLKANVQQGPQGQAPVRRAARVRPPTPTLDQANADRSRTGVGATDVNAPGYRSNEEIERSRQASRPAQVNPPVSRQAEEQRAARARRESFDQSQSQATAQAFAASRRVRQVQIDEEQQARVVASRRASITGSGRTSRTLASGLGALFGGTEQRQIEAQAAASQATRQLQSAERAITPLDDRLRELARGWAGATGETRKFAAEQFRAIRGSDEYRGALLNVRNAVRDDADAQDRLNKISGASSVARNLVAITAAGAAFSVGLKAADTVINAIQSSLGNLIDIQTGFGATSTRVTTALGAQTLAFHGNVEAALATADAQANLSSQSSDYLDNQLRLTAQIKAGAQAQQQASELFRAAAGVGNAPNGLTGGFGGIGGTGLFAQQLGGGRGLSETIQQDVAAFRGRSGPDLLGNVNAGLGYATNPDVRGFIDQKAKEQGNLPVQAAGIAAGVPGGIANTLSALNPFGKNFLAPFTNSDTGATAGPSISELQRLRSGAAAPTPAATSAQQDLSATGKAYLKELEDAGKRGAAALGAVSSAAYRVARSDDEVAAAVASASAAGDAFSATMAETDRIVLTFGDHVATAAEHADALTQIAVGKSITPPEQLGRLALAQERQREIEARASADAIRAQQQYELPAQIGLAQRQTAYSIGTQLPAQAALGALAAPNVPVGTGITPKDQKTLNADLRTAQGLQDQLNDYYKQGQSIIQDTYRPAIVQNFGQAAASSFDAALTAVQQAGSQIAAIQAGISNEQAAYTTAQYNFQLQIARRTLTDIKQITGQVGATNGDNLGLLERQNLQLQRQAQLLQFALAQRQISFQQALAGFQAPGVTPEERQARIKEAQIEADFAQKQLNIQKQLFGNQVQIVDIGNLRQAADIAKQIGLLTQGRRVSLDTAAAEQKLLRLQQIQQQNVAKVSTYLAAVDNLASQAFARISQLESAYGHFLVGITQTMLSQVGVYINGLTSILAGGTGGGTGGHTNTGKYANATGGVYKTDGPTAIGNNAIAGEAGGETLLILSHPRAAQMGNSGGGGMTVFNIDVHGNQVRNDSDLDSLVRKVVQALGKEASLKGLRGIG